MLQWELRRLTDVGLVSSERVGNLRRFQTNQRSPILGELVALTQKTLGLEPMLREALPPLVPRLRAAWLYGAVAKQTDTAASDIDLMAIGEDLSLAQILERVVPLEIQLGRKINPTCYPPAEFARWRVEPDSFVNRVHAQPVVSLVGDLNEFAPARQPRARRSTEGRTAKRRSAHARCGAYAPFRAVFPQKGALRALRPGFS